MATCLAKEIDMSSLQVRLDRIKKSFVDSAPPAAVAVMTRATEELRRSGILGRMAREFGVWRPTT